MNFYQNATKQFQNFNKEEAEKQNLERLQSAINAYNMNQEQLVKGFNPNHKKDRTNLQLVFGTNPTMGVSLDTRMIKNIIDSMMDYSYKSN